MTYLIKNPFISHSNVSDKFIVTDNENAFNKNLKYLGDQWIFKNKDVGYKLNSYGYRMEKNIEDVDFNNYIAFFGCSNTVGVGMPLEDTFSYRIAEQLGTDYINGSIPGASPDFVFYNLVTLFDSAPKLPKVVIIYWPDPSRTCYWENDKLSFFIHNYLPPHKYWHDAYKSYVLENSHIKNTFLFRLKAVRLLCKANNIQLFDFVAEYLYRDFFVKNNMEINIKTIETYPPNNYLSYSTIEWINLVHARDISLIESKLPEVQVKSAHPGIYHQDRIVEEFFKFIKS